MRLLSICAISVILAMLAGCSVFVSAPGDIRTGSDMVIILSEGSSFKTAVTERIIRELGRQGFTTLTDDPNRAKYYHATDFGAVVYMADYWAWHVPWHQKRYYNDNDEAANIIFVVTSGDPDVTIDKPFDAVTSASKEDRVEPVSTEILERLDSILK